MKRSKFSEAQIAFVLRQAEEGTKVERCAGKPVIPRQLSTTGARSSAAWAARS